MPEVQLSQKEEKRLLFQGVLNSPIVTIVATVLTTFIVAAIFFKLGGPVPISVTQTTVEKLSTFDVSGEGSVEVVPDVAKANFGITVSRSTVSAAQKEANTAINKIKQDLQKLGVEETAIKTISYNINPEYSFDEGRSRITGYRVNAQLQVTFSNFETLNQAIDAANAAGANLVGQLRFELSEEAQQKAEDEARAAAIREAKRKAEKIAGAAGVNLGKIINVQEEQTGQPPIVRPLALEAKEGMETEISPGISEITIRVTLSFETR